MPSRGFAFIAGFLVIVACVAAYIAVRPSERPRVASTPYVPTPKSVKPVESAPPQASAPAPVIRESPQPPESTPEKIQVPSKLEQELARQPGRGARMQEVFAKWHTQEPQIAPKLITLFAKGLGVSDGAGDLTWTADELKRTVQLVSTTKSWEDRLPLLAPIARQLGQTDPVSGMQLASSLPIDSERDQFLADVLESWTSRDPNAATAWAMKSSRGGTRTQALSRIVRQLAAESPEAAARIVDTGFDAPSDRAAAAQSLMARWAYKDPLAAGQWLTKFEAGEPRANLVKMLVVPWKKRAEQELQSWAGSISDKALRDEIAAALAAQPAS